MGKLVKQVRLNNLQYNPNRDPQVYRRVVNEPFRIQALLGGAGDARCTLFDQSGRALAQERVSLPGEFHFDLSYSTPGTRMVRLDVQAGGERHSQDLRLDVLEHAWVG